MSIVSLDPLSAEQVNDRLADNQDAQYLTVLMTDGTVHQIPRSECSEATAGMMVHGRTSSEELSISLPASQIAQITHNEMAVSDQPDFQRRLNQEMFFDLLASVEPRALDFRKEFDPSAPILSPRTDVMIGTTPVKYDYDPTEPPRVGTLNGGRDVLLYVDVPWFELAHRAGKSASFGLSLFGFGGSGGVGWSKSLLDEIGKVARNRKARTDSLDGLCRRGSEELSLADNIHLWRLDRLPSEMQRQYLITNQEERDWRPAFVTRSPNDPNAGNTDPHVVAYFATSGFVIGPEAWQTLPFPCRIFGSRLPLSIGTEFGNQLCHIRVRALAVLARDQEVGFTPS